jgi:hypothetical protein
MKLSSSLSQWPWNSNLSSRIEDGGSRMEDSRGDADRESKMED